MVVKVRYYFAAAGDAALLSCDDVVKGDYLRRARDAVTDVADIMGPAATSMYRCCAWD